MITVELRAFLAEEILRMPEFLNDGYPYNHVEHISISLEGLRTSIERYDKSRLTASQAKTLDELLQLSHAFEDSLLSWQISSGAGAEEHRRQIAVSMRDRYLKLRIAYVEQTEADFENITSEELPYTPDTMRRFKLQQIARSCSVPGWNGVFVLGTFDLKKTIHTQQRRAYAVINALHEILSLIHI